MVCVMCVLMFDGTKWAQLSTAFWFVSVFPARRPKANFGPHSYAIWAMGLCHLKWTVGYISLPVYGIIPVPWQLWSRQLHKQNDIYTAFLCTAFTLYGKSLLQRNEDLLID